MYWAEHFVDGDVSPASYTFRLVTGWLITVVGQGEADSNAIPALRPRAQPTRQGVDVEMLLVRCAERRRCADEKTSPD